MHINRLFARAKRHFYRSLACLVFRDTAKSSAIVHARKCSGIARQGGCIFKQILGDVGSFNVRASYAGACVPHLQLQHILVYEHRRANEDDRSSR